MHTCEPPIEVIEEWLASNETIRGTYGHLLLEQQAATDEDLIAAMRPYFESAHLDAREYFHRQIAIDLHPGVDTQHRPLSYRRPFLLRLHGPIQMRRGERYSFAEGG
jgi:hypothetical protein